MQIVELKKFHQGKCEKTIKEVENLDHYLSKLKAITAKHPGLLYWVIERGSGKQAIIEKGRSITQYCNRVKG